MGKFGKNLIEAMGEALAHAEGAKTGVVEHRVDLEDFDARSIRKSLILTQEQMELTSSRDRGK